MNFFIPLPPTEVTTLISPDAPFGGTFTVDVSLDDLGGLRGNTPLYLTIVPKAVTLIQNLAVDSVLVNLANGIANSLDAKLDSALNALDDLNVKNDVAACNSLEAFINAVAAQSGNNIAVEDADGLIDQATVIILLLCGL